MRIELCCGLVLALTLGRRLACAADVNPATLGARGGCNPIPLAYVDEGPSIAVAVRDLASEAAAFRAARSASRPPSN